MRESEVSLVAQYKAFLVDSVKLIWQLDQQDISLPAFSDFLRHTPDAESLLRLAVVAPMKAGKSTVINAILGQPLLPSRNTAMTAIATEVILDPLASEPVIYLPQSLLEAFEAAVAAVYRHKDQQEKLQKAYPHLMPLFKDIAEGRVFFTDRMYGTHQVYYYLQFLNDMVRLTSVLAPEANPVKRMAQLPQIRCAPFFLYQRQQSPFWKKLVMVDTPGPNEAGDNLEIKDIFAKQLEDSDAVLVILDFTQLQTEAAEAVATTVRNMVQTKGIENVYVLVNKVDQRRRGDMTPNQVRELAQRTFGVQGDRVFEGVARQAFFAARFLQVAPHLAAASWRSAPETLEMAEELFGFAWEEALEEVSKEHFCQRVEEQWRDYTGFPQFYAQVIDGLLAIAALKDVRHHLEQMIHNLNQLIAILDTKETPPSLATELQTFARDYARKIQGRQAVSCQPLIAGYLEQFAQAVLGTTSPDPPLTLQRFQQALWQAIQFACRLSGALDSLFTLRVSPWNGYS